MGPWVLVVGMHRSGTSALTGAVGRLGLSLPRAGDLMTGRYDNPVHHESRSLVDFDDSLLSDLGGSWSAPPALDPGWERSPAVASTIAAAARVARRAFPAAGPLAWKDPRLCLLLPFWRAVLPPPLTVLFVWREPLAVARSLRARQELTLSHGLALWDRYGRDATCALVGLKVFVVDFDRLLRDPLSHVRDVASWLASLGCLPAEPAERDIAEAAAYVTAPAAHGARAGDQYELPPVLEHSVEQLRALGGAHDDFPAVGLGSPPPWMADAIRQRHDYETMYALYLRYAKWRRKIPFRSRVSRSSETVPEKHR